jgi:hypothetical protein
MWLVWTLIGIAIFWAWFFLGSRDHCPRCGVSLVDYYDGGGIGHTIRRQSCACGWRRS